ncbi:MAG: nucleotidyl transferase AbiEii/AbiGii toxin family protein [Balneolaceae bacterium]
MLNNTLHEITDLLEKHKLPYMVIGGYAVLFHGEPRFTEDIDIVLGVDSSSLDQVLKAVDNKFEARAKDATQFVEQTNVLPLISLKNNIKVDLIFSFIDFERNAIQKALSVDIEGKKVQIVRAEDLIIYKLLAGRPKDLEDAKNVIEHNLTTIDIQEIDSVVQELVEGLQEIRIQEHWNQIKNL